MTRSEALQPLLNDARARLLRLWRMSRVTPEEYYILRDLASEAYEAGRRSERAPFDDEITSKVSQTFVKA